MTALDKYARLEGPGIWRAGPQDQRRDVVVALGDASLVLSDARSGLVLSHWSLPAVRRLNRGHIPALYSPDPDADGEILETDDSLVIEALETIRAALAPREPLRRLKIALALGAVVLVVAGAFWVPGALVERTAAIVPPAMRAQIGRDALDGITLSSTSERFCADPDGRQVLAALRNRLLGEEWRVSVIAGVPGLQSAHFPGRSIVLGSDLIEGLGSAQALAGWILAEAQAHEATDPLLDALHFAGTRATLGLLTTGALPQGSLSGYAAQRLARPPARPNALVLAEALAQAGQSIGDYALSLPAGAADLAQDLAELPPLTPRDTARLMSDGEWLTLQAICSQ